MELNPLDYGIFPTINENYIFLIRNPPDQKGRDSIQWIWHYLPILRKYAKKCNHITEFGINQVISTYAFLAARPKSLVSIDIDLHSRASKSVREFGGINHWLLNAQKLALQENIAFSVIQGDSTKLEIAETDLLFIDTLHRDWHLRKELQLHAGKVRKDIIFHDTCLFSELNGPIQELIDSEEWILEKKFTDNPGLTIIERKK